MNCQRTNFLATGRLRIALLALAEKWANRQLCPTLVGYCCLSRRSCIAKADRNTHFSACERSEAPRVRRLLSALIAFCLGSVASIQAAPPTPTQQYKALLKDYNAVTTGIRAADTDLKRKEIVGRLAPYAGRFVNLAREHPDDPVALASLKQAIQVMGNTDSAATRAWETNTEHFPVETNPDLAGEIVDLVVSRHLNDKELGGVVDRARYGYRLESEKILSAAAESSPHREIKALATLWQAAFLNDRLHALRLADERPELSARYDALFGSDYLPRLRTLKANGAERRMEKLLEQAAQYTDVKSPFGDAIAQRADHALYELRHLTPGQPAPEIAGVDQNDVHFKLGDYRGRVVLLYFWSDL